MLPVIASFNINSKHWHNAQNGHIAETSQQNNSAHCIFFFAFSLEQEILYFQNSWGYGWGNNGFGSMSFDYFNKHLQEAFVIPPEGSLPAWENNGRGFATLLPIGHYECLEQFDPMKGIRTGWIIIKTEEQRILIDDLFVRPQYRRQGIANTLLASTMDLAKDLNIPVESWVSLANTVPKTATLRAINELSKKYGFHQNTDRVPWANYFLTTSGSGNSVRIESERGAQPGCSLESLGALISEAAELSVGS